LLAEEDPMNLASIDATQTRS